MIVRENEKRKNSLRFNAKEIKLAVKVLNELKDTIDIMYYLMQHEEEHSFVIVLLSAKDMNVKKLLKQEKRDTDMIFKINKKKSIYALICQETKVDGGYRFAQRLIDRMTESGAEEIYCSELEIATTKYTPEDIVFKLIDMYIKAKHENKISEITFNSLH